MEYIPRLASILRPISGRFQRRDRVFFPAGAMSKSLRSRAWERWKVIAKKIGNFQSRVILTLFYLLIVPVFAIIVKVFKDPLHLRAPKGGSYWHERTTPHPTESTARRQF